MKKKITGILIIGVLSLSIAACKKDDPKPEVTTPTGTPALKTLALTVDGTAYEGSVVTIQHGNDRVIAQTTVGNNLYFGISISDTLDPGAYDFSIANYMSIAHTDDNYTTSYSATSGSLTIASHDKTANKISGTFSAVLTRASDNATKTISEGEFNLNY